ncbi:MAG: UTP--glucose-1-phosphate uridylyltransferase [Caulobacteraceae bacterium]
MALQAHEPKEAFRFVSPDEAVGAHAAAAPAVRAMADGRVGAVVLAGGMATRFGGVPKAAVELWPGMTLLDVKLSLVEGVAERFGATVPVVVVVSDATERSVLGLVARRNASRLKIAVLRQTLLPRLLVGRSLAGGSLARRADGRLDMCPPGHGEVIGMLARCGQELAPAVAWWMVSNIDNVLAGLDEGVLSAHIRSAAAATVEVVEGEAGDAGGYLVWSGDRMRILEGFQVREEDRPSDPFLFNTNSFVLGPEALRNHEALPFHAVRKHSDAGHDVIQFEQLLGDVGLLGTLNAVRVARHGSRSRFVALKTREAFDAAKSSLRDLVEGRMAG